MSEIWKPRFTLTNEIASGLVAIEAARVTVDAASLPQVVLAEMSRQARIRATHYSTRIEGNRLTLEEAEEAVLSRRRIFHGRERDVAEVRSYWEALTWVEEEAAKMKPVTEKTVQRIHAMVVSGRRAGLSPYRAGQNVIRDAGTGAIVYMPPEAQDVGPLMGEFVGWIGQAEKDNVPPVLIAALAHYQFATIHPYYDGNGRTARLLATLILHRHGYGLGGIFSLEEYHSRDIQAYYDALDVGGHHNYYMGRAEADITCWLEYFVRTVRDVFDAAKQQTIERAASTGIFSPEEQLRLDHKARTVLALFMYQREISSADVARVLGLSQRMARVYLSEWVEDGWLVVADPSRRARKYALSDSTSAATQV